MNKRRFPDSQVFVENSTYPQHKLKRRIVAQNLIPYVCLLCGVVDWQGKPLTLQLDHINGLSDDCRLENLRFLCPNCHSQTDTYGSKNRGNGRKYKKYRYHEVKELVRLGA